MAPEAVSSNGRIVVSIWGTDSEGKTFSTHLNATNLTKSTATLLGVDLPLAKGSVVGIGHSDRRARCKVTWIGDDGRVSIECLEPDKRPWTDDEIELASSLDAGIKGTTLVEFSIPAIVLTTREKRKHRRFLCAARVKVALPAGDFAWTSLANLSTGGCYVEAEALHPVGTKLDLHITADLLEVKTTGIVRRTAPHPTPGMGIEFVSLMDHHKRMLEGWTMAQAGPARPKA